MHTRQHYEDKCDEIFKDEHGDDGMMMSALADRGDGTNDGKEELILVKNHKCGARTPFLF